MKSSIAILLLFAAFSAHADVSVTSAAGPRYTLLPGSTVTNPTNTSQTLTDAATISWNMNNGAVATVTLGGNRTIAAPTNLKVGTYVLHVIQDGMGSRTLTWNSVFKWPGGSAPALTATAAARDLCSFVSDGTNLYGNCLPDVK